MANFVFLFQGTKTGQVNLLCFSSILFTLTPPSYMRKEEARRLIAEGKTSELIGLVIEEIDKIGETELTATEVGLICISGRFHQANKHFLGKLINYEEFDCISNKVNLSFLELIELME